jgi:hypothetical protein
MSVRNENPSAGSIRVLISGFLKGGRGCRMLYLTDFGTGIVSSFAEGLEFLKPDLLKQRQFICEVEIRVVFDFYRFQYFEYELILTVFIPFLLETLVAVASDRQLEPATIEYSLEIQAASKKNLSVCGILYLKDSRRLFSFLEFPLDFFFRQ